MLTLGLLVTVAVLVWPARERGHPRPPGPGTRWWPTARPAGRDGPASASGGLFPALRARIRPGRDDAWAADLAEVTAVGLTAGLDLPSAVLAATRSPAVRRAAPWVEARVVEAVAAGEPVWSCLDDVTADDVGLLVTAWRLAEEAGAPAAGVTSAAARAVRERRAARHRAAVAVSGPRTSMWLLSALPLVGPVGGTVVGFGPDRLYATGAARLTAAVGVLLTLAGWGWARSMLARSARPATTGRPAAVAPERGGSERGGLERGGPDRSGARGRR